MKYVYFAGLSSICLPFMAAAAADTNADHAFEVQGRIMVDYIAFDGIHNEGNRASDWLLRRARLGVKHKSGKDWQAELEINIDHASEEADITDGYIAYEGWDFADIAFGRMKEAFGLEETTSSLDISTMERSIVTEVFAPGRNFGIQLAQDDNWHSWNLGLFQTSKDEHGLDGYALTGRFTLSPINRPGSVLHLGLSGSRRDMLGNAYEVNEPLAINAGDKVVESRVIAAETINQISVEGAFVAQSFSMQGEWMQQQVHEMPAQVQAGHTATFSGYYVLASWFLTGESRQYDEGSFDETSPAGERGAWELVARYSDINLVDLREGSEAETYLLGVNYYATGRAKLMLNLTRGNNMSSSSDETGEGNAISARVQYEF